MKEELYHSKLFSALHNEEPTVTLEELQLHVKSAHIGRSSSFRITALVVAGIAVVGGGYYLANENQDQAQLPAGIAHIADAHKDILFQRETNVLSNSSASKLSESLDATEKSAIRSHGSLLNAGPSSPVAVSTDEKGTQRISQSSESIDQKIVMNENATVKSVNSQTDNSAEKKVKDQEVNHNQSRSDRSAMIDTSRQEKPASDRTDNSIISIRSRDDDNATRIRVFAGPQAGVIISSLNSSGGGIAVSFDHDWQHVGFRYSSTFGTKGNSSELFRKIPDGYPFYYQYSQNILEYTLQFGATLKQGDFWATFSGGPNYTNSNASTSSYDSQIGQRISSSYQWKGLGASAQVSFGYRFNKYVGTELTGFVSDHSQVAYGGILFSLVFGAM
ncbi:MAG: hypothetical protein Q8916_06365 [Bacteroidota bacterium]|nr:hypothetical protein [Bacteroidota bacterium]MDP4230014.1 hypothetical protein [Bacteroidota bacterium]MDP4234823.1 hypothetical protein [Bacteroidota bacterium]